MTVTDNGRVEVDDELLARGHELVDGGQMPSKRELQKHLGKRWEVVNAVLTRLGEEAREAATQRRREARAKMRRLGSRKRSGSAWPFRHDRQRTVNEITAPTAPEPVVEPVPVPVPEAVQKHPDPPAPTASEKRPVVTWPALLVAAPAAVAIWAGWVAIGRMTGFGPVDLLPGIGNGFVVDTAITLPVGVEAYAAYAFYVALHPGAPRRARRFAGWSALLAVVLGMGGQTAYHLMSAAGMHLAPWQITTVVSCLPVGLFGAVAALVHMVRAGGEN